MAEKQRRSDAGSVRQTARDAQLLEFMAHQYGVPLDLVAAAADVSMPRAYGLASRWKKAKWVDTGKVDAGPTWVWPNKATCTQYLGWDAPHWRPLASTTAHVRAVAAVRLHVAGLDPALWESERSLRHQQGYRQRGTSEPHTPDGVQVLPDGRRVLIEVELTPKAPSRYLAPNARTHQVTKGLLQMISNRANDLGCSAVAYWCAPAALSVVQAQIAEYQQRVRAEKNGQPDSMQWFVRGLEEVPGWTVPR